MDKKHYTGISSMNAALKDISDWLNESGWSSVGGGDVWVITPAHLNTKEQRWLNAKLGLRGINRIGNKNGFKKK